MACLLLGLFGHYLNHCGRKYSEMPLKLQPQDGGHFVLVSMCLFKRRYPYIFPDENGVNYTKKNQLSSADLLRRSTAV